MPNILLECIASYRQLRKDDSSWQFLCGQTDHSDESIRIISMKEATELDQTVNDLFEMPEGICAERTMVGGKWEPFKLNE